MFEESTGVMVYWGSDWSAFVSADRGICEVLYPKIGRLKTMRYCTKGVETMAETAVMVGDRGVTLVQTRTVELIGHSHWAAMEG